MIIVITGKVINSIKGTLGSGLELHGWQEEHLWELWVRRNPSCVQKLNVNYIINKIGFNLDMIWSKDKILFMVTHEISYCVTVSIWLLEVLLNR